MDDPLAIFYSGAPLKQIVLRPPARKAQPLSDDLSTYFRPPDESTAASTCVGTDYVDEYLQMEDKRLQETAALYKIVPGTNGQDFDQISLTTVSASNVLFDEEQQKIYSTYDLTYTPNKSMPICQYQERIVSMIETNPVTIIQGPTGCGKTTQVPQFILDSCYKKNAPCNIIVTQPRRIAAMSIAKRASTERGWPCGTLVGFKVGLINNTTKDTRLTYCTTGVLLQRLVNEKHMNDFTHVIIDEIHERDQDMDFLLLIVRKFLRSNSRGVRVILMSATFNVDKFSKYFAFYAGDKLIQGPIIDIQKSNFFTVREFYLEEVRLVPVLPQVKADEPEVSKEMLKFSSKLLKVMDKLDQETDRFGRRSETERPTALIFLPGIHEIEELHNILNDPSEDELKWDIVVLHSSVTNEEQSRIFEDPPTGYRRIILSTNIAESSLTVPNVKYVIDFCLTKQLVIDPTTNFQTLELTWASKANCQQRAGRTGRVMDGRVYRLVPKLFYQQVLPDENPPEISRAPLENIYLRAKMLNMDKPVALLALSLDPPDLTNIYKTVLNLKESGALLEVADDVLDGELTDMGRVMAQLPLEIHISKLIVLGHVFSVLREAIIIGASMTAKNMFSAPFKEKLQSYKTKLMWARNTNSDGIAFLNAFKSWAKHRGKNFTKRDKRSEEMWAKKGFLQIRVLREVEATVTEITNRLETMGIREMQGSNRVELNPTEQLFVLKVIIAGAFYPQFYLAHPRADERTSVKELGGLDPTKTVYLTGWPYKQPGPLYAKRFQEAFNTVLGPGSSSIGVKFDHSNRIYLQFNKTEVKGENELDLPGEIPGAVYQALKLRNILRGIEIPLMEVNAANARADELNLQRDALSLYMPKPKAVTDETIFKLRPLLPALELEHIMIDIQRIVDPSHFWVTNSDCDTQNNLRRVKSLIRSMGPLSSFHENPTVGTLVLAPQNLEESQRTHIVTYDRAVIQNVSLVWEGGYQAQVFFIDSGDMSKVKISDLRVIPTTSQLQNIPAAAFQCALSHVKPAVLNTLTEEWSDRAKKAFVNIVSGKDKTIYGKVYSVVNSLVSVILHVSIAKPGDPENPTKIQVNDYLVTKGYAEYREEDYLSKWSHTLRQDFDKLSAEERSNHEDLQHSQLYFSNSYVEPPDLSDCSTSVSVKGPYSPLEVQLSNLLGGGVGLVVSIDPVSVNSILLDPTLNNPQPRLVIASSVAQASTSRNLTLRNTTLLPNIPGLIHLLALIFAPKIELRTNNMKTRNVGALCGLGCEVGTRVSLFPEHDMTLNFDVDINTDDIENINRLRYWMSMGIFVDQDADTDDVQKNADILKCQTKVMDNLFDLMNRKREPVIIEMDARNSKWGKYPESEFIEPPEVNAYKSLIYKLHRVLDLKEKDEARELMIHHLEDLREKANMKVLETAFEDIECKLCRQKISGILHLRNHITSPYHGLMEKELRRDVPGRD